MLTLLSLHLQYGIVATSKFALLFDQIQSRVVLDISSLFP
jgi:hypothetical protein